MKDLFAFSSYCEPMNNLDASHKNTDYKRLEQLSGVKDTIDFQPKRQIEDFKVIQEKNIPEEERGQPPEEVRARRPPLTIERVL
jgi:hypothetical protein